MNIPVTLIVSMTAALLGTVLRKYYTDKTKGSTAAVFLFNGFCSLIATLILFLWGGITRISPFTLILGIVFGLITAIQTVTNLKAIEVGPLSYTTVIISCSTLISAISGALFFDERLEIAHIIGIALMLVSFGLAVERKADKERASLRWLIYCVVAFFCTGSIGIIQKVHQSSSFKEELNAFLVIAFAVSFVFSLLGTLYFAKRESVSPKNIQFKKAITWILVSATLVSGACCAVNNKLNLYLSGVMDSAVFFPIVNGGGLVLTTLAAILIFRERLSLMQWIGMLCGIASVIFLCNPF